MKLEEDYTVLESHFFQTPIYETSEEAWRDLVKYLEKHAKWNMVFLREVPNVIHEFNKETQVENYIGVVRFAVSPVKYDDSIHIPIIGGCV